MRFRSPWMVALLYPFETPLVFCMLAVSVVFTFWPDALQHAPVSFEERGFIHHMWHYTLLSGAALAALGLLWETPRRTLVEAIGLVMVACAVTLNLVAILTADLATDGIDGWRVALRIGVLVGMILRVYILLAEPTVSVSVQTKGYK